MICRHQVFSGKRRFLLLVVAVWIGVNYATVYILTRWEHSQLEIKYSLRPGTLGDFTAERFTVTRAGRIEVNLPYRLYAPQSKEKLPVILYLHGSGERGSDNCKQLRGVPTALTNEVYKQSHRCFVIVPQCPANANWQTFRRIGGPSDQGNLMQLVEEVLQNPLADRDRVYLMGFSMGSFGTWQLAADSPNHFAAVVAISGGESIELAFSLTDLPIWAVHGDQDKSCPVEDTRRIVAKIKEEGGTPVYSELPGVGHDAWLPAILENSEIMDWLFRQKRSPN